MVCVVQFGLCVFVKFVMNARGANFNSSAQNRASSTRRWWQHIVHWRSSSSLHTKVNNDSMNATLYHSTGSAIPKMRRNSNRARDVPGGGTELNAAQQLQPSTTAWPPVPRSKDGNNKPETAALAIQVFARVRPPSANATAPLGATTRGNTAADSVSSTPRGRGAKHESKTLPASALKASTRRTFSKLSLISHSLWGSTQS